VEYLDFILELTPRDRFEYSLKVTESPVGRIETTIPFPFDDHTLEKHFIELKLALLSAGANLRAEFSPEEEAVREFGKAMFDSIFASNVRELYDASLGAAGDLGKGLRLKLLVSSPRAASLPWEFLYDSRQEEFICLSQKTPIVRYVEPSEGRRTMLQSMSVTGPLRIFGVAPPYRGYAKLEVESEQSLVAEAIKDLRSVELIWFKGKSWRDLQREMERARPLHIFHFIGHGRFDEENQQGTVTMMGDDGGPYHMNARELGLLLEGHSDTLRLVILNSCEGARSGEKDIFSSVAATLARRSVPVVLAMQYRISDKAAIEFARSFYTYIAEGLSVEAAVAEARKAISLAFYKTVEWGTPVIYMCSRDGDIFNVQEMQVQKQKRERTFHLYDEGRKHYKTRQWRTALSYFDQIRQMVGAYRDVDDLIEDIQRQQAEEEVEHAFNSARQLAELGDWTQATERLQELLEGHPDHERATALLAQAQQEKHLLEIYEDGQRKYEAGKWEDALKCFQELNTERGDYKDVGPLIRRVTFELTKERVAHLYQEVGYATDSQNWKAAIGALERILSIDANDNTAKLWLVRARREQDTSALFAKADGLYGEGKKLNDPGILAQALDHFREVRNEKSDYKNVSVLIGEIERRLAELKRKREERDEQLQTEAEAVFRGVQETDSSDKVAAAIETLKGLHAHHSEPEAIRRWLILTHRKLFDLGLQQRMETIYVTAKKHYEAGRLSEAWLLFSMIGDKAGAYKDVDVLLAETEKRRIGQYLRKWNLGLVTAGLFTASSIGSIVWLNITQIIFPLGFLALMGNAYYLYSLIKSADRWRLEPRRLRAARKTLIESGTPPHGSGSMDRALQTTASDSSTSRSETSAEERLSHRLTSLCRMDDQREIDLSYVTCLEYQLFQDEVLKPYKSSVPPQDGALRSDAGQADRPVRGITCEDANGFTKWLTRHSGGGARYRLPSVEEAIRYPATDSTLAAWCSHKGGPKLVGLLAVNKHAIRQQIKQVVRQGIPMPRQLRRELIVSQNNLVDAAWSTMAQALRLRLNVPLYIAQALIRLVPGALCMELDPNKARDSLTQLAKTVNLKYATTFLEAERESLLFFSDEVLRDEDTKRGRELAKELEGKQRKGLPKLGSVIVALFDIIDARTPSTRRQSQQGYAVHLVELAYEGYGALRKEKKREARSRRRPLWKRVLQPAIAVSDNEVESIIRKLKDHQQSLAQFYWWWRIAMAREADELPSWEGIRIVREQ
jgi:tetratricopeptide (TPR) repeat protein